MKAQIYDWHKRLVLSNFSKLKMVDKLDKAFKRMTGQANISKRSVGGLAVISCLTRRRGANVSIVSDRRSSWSWTAGVGHILI